MIAVLVVVLLGCVVSAAWNQHNARAFRDSDASIESIKQATMRWKAPSVIPGGFPVDAVVLDDLVIVQTAESAMTSWASVTAYNATNGAVVWHRDVTQEPSILTYFLALSEAKRRLYVGYAPDGALTVLNADDGSVLFQPGPSAGNSLWTNLLDHGNRTFVSVLPSTNFGQVMMFVDDWDSVSMLWQWTAPGGAWLAFPSPVLGFQRATGRPIVLLITKIDVLPAQFTVFAVAVETGSTIWSLELGIFCPASYLSVDPVRGQLVFALTRCDVPWLPFLNWFAVDLEDGSILSNRTIETGFDNTPLPFASHPELGITVASAMSEPLCPGCDNALTVAGFNMTDWSLLWALNMSTPMAYPGLSMAADGTVYGVTSTFDYPGTTQGCTLFAIAPQQHPGEAPQVLFEVKLEKVFGVPFKGQAFGYLQPVLTEHGTWVACHQEHGMFWEGH